MASRRSRQLASTISNRRGMTLVELVIVVLVLALLAAIAAPMVREISSDAKQNRIMSDIHVLFKAIDLYVALYEEYPANEDLGKVPVELQDYLHSASFTEPTPIGGKYDFNGTGTSYPFYGVSIHTPSGIGRPVYSDSFYLNLDNKFDDGDYRAGWIRASKFIIFFKHTEKL